MARNYLNGGVDNRFVVTKSNGDPIDAEAKYFVLRIDKDPHALASLYTYALSVADENPDLADDLCRLVDKYKYGR